MCFFILSFHFQYQFFDLLIKQIENEHSRDLQAKG